MCVRAAGNEPRLPMLHPETSYSHPTLPRLPEKLVGRASSLYSEDIMQFLQQAFEGGLLPSGFPQIPPIYPAIDLHDFDAAINSDDSVISYRVLTASGVGIAGKQPTVRFVQVPPYRAGFTFASGLGEIPG